jgi:hypothetical protein
MKHVIKIKNKEIKIDSELTPIEVQNIEAKILDDLNKLESQEIISTLHQMITLVVRYAVEKYLIEKKQKMRESEISSKIDEISKIVKSALDKDTMF